MGFGNRCEYIVRTGCPSSPEVRGEDPRSASFDRGFLCAARAERKVFVDSGGAAARNDVDGGEEYSGPSVVGKEAATGPCLAIYETPWLSNEAGRGASKTFRWPVWGKLRREVSGGEPNWGDAYPVSIVGMES